MNRYTIYCTAEQTKKALELGAPITTIETLRSKDTLLSDDVIKYDENTFTYVKCPTAEEMLGWLEEKNIYTTIRYTCYGYKRWQANLKHACYTDANLVSLNFISTRKEATLAAIDAALDYLIENKK